MHVVGDLITLRGCSVYGELLVLGTNAVTSTYWVTCVYLLGHLRTCRIRSRAGHSGLWTLDSADEY